MSQDSLKVRSTLTVEGKEYDYFSLPKASETLGDVSKLPFSLKVILENLLRHEDGKTVSLEDVKAVQGWLVQQSSTHEIAYRPARVLMQDFTGVPAVVDLASMRDGLQSLGGDPKKINPLNPVDLVIDHSVMVDYFASEGALALNVEREFERNAERYTFLNWGSKAFDNFSVVPPGTGICHQVNLECLAQTVWTKEEEGRTVAYPDTLVGTDSHTTMVNGLAVLGWGVGGIEAEAAMLGQPVSMLIPEVVGLKLSGKLKEGTTATDLVLTVTQILRAQGVVGKFVEFYGDGLSNLSLADRATIANMAPEYGATCGFFPIDAETIRYLNFTGRSPERVALVEAYAKAQGFWREEGMEDPVYTKTLSLDISTVEPSIAGPKRPQDRVLLSDSSKEYLDVLAKDLKESPSKTAFDDSKGVAVAGKDYSLTHGDLVIAAITSCTNTSNPSVMVAAGLVARKAKEKGLFVKPWIKTSLAPGSQVVSEYLEAANLQKDFDAQGFNLVGYGCTTCIGNSGPLPEEISAAITQGDLRVASVLSGNRNFEGRVHQQTRMNYLASPPLVVAYALAGSMKVDLVNDPLGTDSQGNDVFLKDIWPSNAEVQETVTAALSKEMFVRKYADVFKGTQEWQDIKTTSSLTYGWDDQSTYVQRPPFFEGMTQTVSDFKDIESARALAVLGDSVTTDHISPAGAIKKDSPAGLYLLENEVKPTDFNSYGSRRGNHQVMMRGTFANTRIRNEMVPGVEGGYTQHVPSGEKMSIYDAAMRYQEEKTDLVVIAGKEYGTGSSRDWAAKGTNLLGVKAVITESFERIHRSNLVGMGVLPLQFKNGETRQSLGLDGSETYSITGLKEGLKARADLKLKIVYSNGEEKTVDLLCRIDTDDELNYYRNGGILHYVLRNLAKAS